MRRNHQARPNQQTCSHSGTISVVTAGLERVVCESCGHVSVNYLTGLSGAVERSAFARPADSQGMAPAISFEHFSANPRSVGAVFQFERLSGVGA